MPNPKRTSALKRKRGFALVVTLSLMILLTVIAVGLLSLSAVSLRSSGTASAQAIAQANARLAMMIAIGELQKHAGADQRVTGRADILDPASPNPAWTAVWNSKGGEPAFLVSGNEQATMNLETMPTSQPAQYYKAGTKLADADSVFLFGSKLTLGEQVRAPVVKIKGQNEGSYAYWVADEGVKARFNQKNPYAPGEPYASQASAAALAQSNSTRYASADLKTQWPADNKNSKLAITLNQGQLVAPGAAKFSQTYQHGLTPHSRGLLVDVKNGGLKRDLTQAFEDDGVFLKWFGATPISETLIGGSNYSPTNTGEAKIPVTGYKPDSAPEKFFLSNKFFLKTNFTGPNWGNLRFFYKAAENVTSGSSGIVYPYPTVNAQMRKNKWNPYTDYEESANNNFANDAQHTNFFIAPVMARVQMGYRLTAETMPGDPSGNHCAVVEFKPLFGLWNPYNVTIKPTTYRIDWEMSPIFDLTINGTTYKIKLNDWYGDSSESEYIRLVIDQSVDLQPGEYRMFSVSKPKTLTPNSFRKGGSGSTILVGPAWGELGVIRMRLPIIEANPTTFKDWTFPANSQVKVNNVSLSEGTHKAFGDAASAGNFLTLKPGYNGKDQGNISNFRTTNFWQPGVSGLTPETVEDLPPMSVAALAASPEPIATWSFSLRSAVETVRAGQTPQRIRNLIDSNVRACVANSRWDGSVNGQGMTCISAFIGDGPNGRGKIQGTGEPESDGTGTRYRMLNGDLKQTHVVAFDVPSSRPLSLGHFQHATLGRYNYEPSFIIGNSYANPRVPLDKDINTAFLAAPNTLTVHDSSYIVNDAIWDKYFLSGLSPSAIILPDANFAQIAKGERPAPNARISPLDPTKAKSYYVNPTDEQTTNELAGKLAVEGAFNVNSTSVQAWRAVLAGMADTDLPTFNGITNGATVWKPNGGVSFPRFSRIPGEKDNFWKGYFALTETQLNLLAVEITNQVRARGPFRSLGAFVNRSLTVKQNAAITTERDIRESGALQAALDAKVTKINDAIPTKTAEKTDKLTGDFKFDLAGQSQAAGNAGFLLQGDILQALGPVLTVRSDTFVIRTYGNAVDKKGNIIAKAWCEAVVQRTPTPLLPSDNSDPANPVPITTLDKPGTKFGRKFELVSFRWLYANEI